MSLPPHLSRFPFGGAERCWLPVQLTSRQTSECRSVGRRPQVGSPLDRDFSRGSKLAPRVLLTLASLPRASMPAPDPQSFVAMLASVGICLVEAGRLLLG